jgi:hypothetical protein
MQCLLFDLAAFSAVMIPLMDQGGMMNERKTLLTRGLICGILAYRLTGAREYRRGRWVVWNMLHQGLGPTKAKATEVATTSQGPCGLPAAPHIVDVVREVVVRKG